ncbi:UNVERIFIED_CONTAM: hypothetical protein PYX00_009719 [Menopon gallinae]|uniref:Acylphosphatase-like domain-containing protein n=1 Tax=Menopon gallinae TaxID=328185 RepID=A0AAW2HC65_9NEOP
MGVRELQLTSPLVSVEFEVFGYFEGAYFKRYCKEECNKLGVGGWVKTSARGTIIGKLEGPRTRVDQMISWLSYCGSPGSQIDQCRLYNHEYLRRPEFRSFSIRF